MASLWWILVLITTQITHTSSKPVEVTLYAESLCPYCADFIQDNNHLILNDLADIISFRYVAYGNARLNQHGTLQCQHGPKECELNRVINCIQDLHPNQNRWLPFVVCLESDADKQNEPDELVISCSKATALDPSPILSCAASAKGDELEKKAAEETASLDPQHTYVPWLVINGVAIGQDMDKMGKFVCVAAEPEARPDICYNDPDPPSFRTQSNSGVLAVSAV
jgi:interferon, gamma-inducible protein 30